MRLAVLACAVALALCGSAHGATPFSVDASDLWYNASEEGWGVNIAQQGDVAFLTLFVYGDDSKPTWFVASDLQGARDGTTVTYSGDLLATTGPAFSAPRFDPALVTRTKVGTAVFTVINGTDATLSYTVSGRNVVKRVVRQTWRENNATGTYIGYVGGTCATSVNGPEESLTFVVTQAIPAFRMSTTGTSGASCGYTGTYTQQGRLGSVDGTFSCSTGRSGSFSLDAIEASPDGLLARLTTQIGTCTFTTRLAGIRRN
jgi:hypothetical protein